MRTTLDLDERVLSVARARARARGSSLGKEVSELALKGLAAAASAPARPGFPTLPSVPGHVITDQMVEDALAD